MIGALGEAAATLEAAPELRVVILCAEGEMFCAGGDIDAWSGLPALDMWRDWTRAGHRAFEALARLRLPMIAALNGSAFGGGLELAATADFRIGEAQIELGLPEAGLGMAPGFSGTQRLVRRFGAQTVRRMAVGGQRFGAAEALRLGVIDELADKGQALARAQALAEQIAARGPIATQIVKAMINAAEGEDRDAPLEGLAGALTATTHDLTEGVAAFRAKRPPRFTDQ